MSNKFLDLGAKGFIETIKTHKAYFARHGHFNKFEKNGQAPSIALLTNCPQDEDYERKITAIFNILELTAETARVMEKSHAFNAVFARAQYVEQSKLPRPVSPNEKKICQVSAAYKAENRWSQHRGRRPSVIQKNTVKKADDAKKAFAHSIDFLRIFDGMSLFHTHLREIQSPANDNFDIERYIRSCLKLINHTNKNVMRLFNETQRHAYRQAVKRIAEAYGWHIVKKEMAGGQYQYDLKKFELPYFRSHNRRFKRDLHALGRFFGFIVAISCGLLTGIAIFPYIQFWSILVGVAGFVANFNLFWRSTPRAFSLLFYKSFKKGLFRCIRHWSWEFWDELKGKITGDADYKEGRNESENGEKYQPGFSGRLGHALFDVLKAVCVVLAVFFAFGAGASMGFFTFTSAPTALAFMATLSPAAPVVVAAILGIATAFGIMAMMLVSIVNLISTTWTQYKLAFRQLFFPDPGTCVHVGHYIAHFFRVLFTAVFTLGGLALAALAAVATLGVMHNSALSVLQSTFKLAPQTAAVASAVIVYVLNMVPRVIFNLKNAISFFSKLGHAIISGFITFCTGPLSAMANVINRIEKSLSSWRGHGETVLLVCVMGNAVGNGALGHLKSGVALLTSVVNWCIGGFYQVSAAVEGVLAAITTGGVSLAVNWLATRARGKNNAKTSDNILRVFHSWLFRLKAHELAKNDCSQKQTKGYKKLEEVGSDKYMLFHEGLGLFAQRSSKAPKRINELRDKAQNEVGDGKKIKRTDSTFNVIRYRNSGQFEPNASP